MMKIYLNSVMVCLLCLFCQKVAAGPQITARDGILYRDGKPCFLVGVFSPYGYDPTLDAHPLSCGEVESIPGKKGNGLQVSFYKVAKPVFRSAYFSAPNTAAWVEKKYKSLKFWVKGDGSDKTIHFVAENWNGTLGTTMASAELGKFSLQDTNWNQVVFSLEDKYQVLKQANSLRFSYGTTDSAFSYCVDEISAVTEQGEEDVLFDFDGHGVATSWNWNKWNDRDKFKDDPVYKALRDDPLYQEISRKNFETIGMNTLHLAGISERNNDPVSLLKGADQGSFGEVTLCKKLDGMPMVPGFVFAWGAYYGGKEAEKWVQSIGLPPSILQRYPNGSPVGSYMAICFEDPLGNKFFRMLWQKAARRFLSNGANIYAYEMLNENSGFYLCGCPHNQEMFIGRLKDKYRDIETLNKDWGTSYGSFEEIRKQIPKLGDGSNKIRGLTVAWNKFLEDRYVEMLWQGGQWIHEVEDELGKPHALIGQMGYPTWDCLGFGGADMYKLARGLDCLEVESGVKFGPGEFLNQRDHANDYLFIKGYKHQMALDLADAASQGKVVLNTEHHWDRYGGGRRLESRKSDIITSLWIEFLRGVSAVHTYAWEVVYASKEEALATASTGNSQLLSPHVFPRESLNGYKEIQDELARVADVVMARPRLGRNAQVAVLFSRPTARFLVGVPGWDPASKQKENTSFYWSHQYFYDYLLENHYPMRYFYEEQLVDDSDEIMKYKVVLVPHSDNIYPETLKRLRAYVEGGGMLVCFGDALLYDEYGNERYGAEASALLGAGIKKREKAEDEADLKEFGVVRTLCRREISVGKAKVLSAFSKSAAPFITVNEVGKGKGKVFHVNADAFDLTEKGLVPVMDYIMGQIGIEPAVEITGPGDVGGREPRIEAHVIDGKGSKVVFLVNWIPDADRVVKVKINGVKDKGKYYVADIAKDCLYTRDGREWFAGKELREGIYLLLPAEERVVLLLTGKKYSAANKQVELLSASTARELNEKNSARLKAELEKEAAEAARKKEIIFGMRGGGNLKEIIGCIKSATGDAVEEIVLKSNNSIFSIRNYGLRPYTDSVLTYLLVFKGVAQDDEKEKILVKVLNALASKYGDKLKIISGWKEADILKAQEYKVSGVCLLLDLRKQANMGFRDEKADDRKGGLFDEGRSLKGLPVGSNIFAGIVFEIIDPAKNNGLACIVLRGKAKPYFPEKAEGIAVERKAKNIYLLHAAAYCAQDSHEIVYRLKFNYADNTDAYADIKAGSEIVDWFSKPEDMLTNLTNARPGWMGKAMESDGKEFGIILYCAKITNPHPEKEIKTIAFISANNAAVPAIFAITAEENEK